MAYNIENFKQVIKGVFRPTLFMVSFAVPSVISGLYGDMMPGAPSYPSNAQEMMSLTCKTAELPASEFGSFEVPFLGRKVKFAGDRTYNDWNTTFIVDKDWTGYRALYNWSMAINSPNSNVAFAGDTTKYNLNDLKADLSLSIFHQNGVAISEKGGNATCLIVGAFPTQIGEVTLDWDSTDSSAECSVTWAYDYVLYSDDNYSGYDVYKRF